MLKGSMKKVARQLRQTFFARNNTHRDLVIGSGLFDAAWYQETYPDVRASGADPLDHYLDHGWREGRSPGPDFDSAFYLATYPDVAAAAMEPVFHYVRHGAGEGRQMSPLAAPGQATALQNDMPQLHRIATAEEAEADEFFAWVGRRVQGRHVLVLGGPSQHNIERIIRLMEKGAASARLFTSEIAPAHDKLFHAVVEAMPLAPALKARLSGLERLERVRNGYGIWTEDSAPQRWFALSYLGDPDLLNKVGPVDVLVTIDIAQLEVEPLRLFQAVGACRPKEWLGEFPVTLPASRTLNGKAVSLSEDSLLYAGTCSPEEAALLQAEWGKRGVDLVQFTKVPGGLTPASASAAGLDGVWWWFWGGKALEKLCARGGFTLQEAQDLPSRPMRACRLTPKSP